MPVGKNKVRYSLTITKDTDKLFQAYVKENNLTKSKALEKLLKEVLTCKSLTKN